MPLGILRRHRWWRFTAGFTVGSSHGDSTPVTLHKQPNIIAWPLEFMHIPMTGVASRTRDAGSREQTTHSKQR